MKIKTKLKDERKTSISLITSNINGAIIANIVAMMLKIKHISILQLGPDNSEEDNRFLSEINKNEIFVYVFDFIGLGNEQRKIITILRLKEAELYKSVGLGFYSIPKDDAKKTIEIIDTKFIKEKMRFCSRVEDIYTLEGDGIVK